MSSELQNKYIADLVVMKTKEFKEVKELILSSGIVGENAETVNNAQTIADISNVLTDLQAYKFIDLLISSKEPSRSTSYSNKRILKTAELLDDIKIEIDSWDFS